MHLLRAQQGEIVDGKEAVDLGQTPGEIVFLSAADTELALLAQAQPPASHSLCLANWMALSHPLSVDVYVDEMIARAKLVIVRLLGGAGYWSYGVEQISACCRARGIPLAVLPGDDQPDAELDGLCSLPRETAYRLWQYCVHGGLDNARELLNYCAFLLDNETAWREPAPLLRAGVYWPDSAGAGRVWPALDPLRARWRPGAPRAALVFYRALLQAGDLEPVDALIEALARRGVDTLPLYCASLKDPVSAETIGQLLNEFRPGLILNATGFAVSTPGAARSPTPFDSVDGPILQVVFSGGTAAAWQAGNQGLSARNIAMNVALPEVDGRILSRAVAFKSPGRYDTATQCQVVNYQVAPDRAEFVAELSQNWLRLRDKPPAERRVAIILANYPNRDGRLGNGVGLDTPAGTVNILRALRGAGYRVDDIPADGNALIQRLAAGPTNASSDRRYRCIEESLSMADYQLFFATLPMSVQKQVTERWGAPESDPFYQPGEVDCGRFAIAAFRCGRVAIGLQPARGYQIDPVASYHDPDLVPPHGYLAFYAWLRNDFTADAVVHMGKHGNLEWLPGKALVLSENCFPEAALGPVPHLYPFIVNDPGEGTQAKRRAQAVIVDHLTPPLTRAETYGELAELEQLVDEYYEASGVDPRRLKVLREQILEKIRFSGLDKDCGIAEDDDADAALVKLDAYLCELKELQIRDGLHIFGEAPAGELLTDLLVALVRLPRSSPPSNHPLREGKIPGNESILRALASDLALGDTFDPLDCDFAEVWTGPRPAALAQENPWRHNGDTVERLEWLANDLVGGRRDAEPQWQYTQAVLRAVSEQILPAVTACGAAELRGILTGLNGRFVEPGPSGAPTRGRPEVLPTGRNFYSVDNRTVPTPAAYNLGWKSAALLLERHRQEHGEWPQRLALSAWGTANMRTGGDDIAQALALMGVKPTWDTHSRRVTGFEILPLDILDRPRVDVTFRISGFFRDAFPAQIDLVDSAARAVAALDEKARDNPLAARVAADKQRLLDAGLNEAAAARQAGFRVFGSKPGAYGAGLQALIDERGWQNDADLAKAYLAWGGYAYGGGVQGAPAQQTFALRLAGVEAVLHNQDNREHDLLDSDDYYQFEGGLTAAVRHLAGAQPAVYHNDHSRPESPKIRTLQEEIGRIVRARVANPKWIKGVMRHGYKGAFEMAATVDYLFAFAATARVVSNHHFDAVFDAYLGDDAVREFLAENNPAALKEMAERLLEAQQRGLWQIRSNSAQYLLNELSQ